MNIKVQVLSMNANQLKDNYFACANIKKSLLKAEYMYINPLVLFSILSNHYKRLKLELEYKYEKYKYRNY